MAPSTEFIVGMSRAGTSWLSEALARHPDVAVFGESAFWGRHYVEPEADGRYGPEGLRHLRKTVGSTNMTFARTGEPGGLVTTLFHESLDRFEQAGARPTPREVFDDLARAVAQAEGKTRAVEKTPHHVNWLSRIRGAYPDARIVVMMREPYGFMRSYKHQGDRKRADVRERFQSRYHPAACALVYRRSLISAQEALSLHGTLRVSYDDVCATPTDVLEQVQSFLGLSSADLTVPAVNSSFPSGIRPDLDPVDVFWMNRIAGRAIRQAGYRLRPSNAGALAVARSIAHLPAWAARLRGRNDLKGRYLLRWLR